MNRNNRSNQKFSAIAIAGFLAAVVSACSPAPRHTLTTEEKLADLQWLYSTFSENYAPLEYKMNRFQFQFDQLKKDTDQAAIATKSNEEFYMVMHGFVAKFKDAHTSSSLLSSGLPGRTQVAYVGFGGRRLGNSLIVTSLLPTMKQGSFPIKLGDRIEKVNGKTLKELVDTQTTMIRNLGQTESNYTALFNRYFSRDSLTAPMPTDADMTLSVTRGSETFEVTVPWIKKDLYDFAIEQAAADKKTSTASNANVASIFEIGLNALQGKIDLIPAAYRNIIRSENFKYMKSFVYIDERPTWMSSLLSGYQDRLAGKEAATTMDELKALRNVQSTAFFVPGSAIYPTYVTFEKMLDAQGKETGATKAIATMYLNTFSTSDDDGAYREVKSTLSTLQNVGVKEIIIDMINNGGGSLQLGLQLAQLFSKEKIVMPDMQFKTSESWMDEFDRGRLQGANDAEKEIARRVFASLVEDRMQGKSLSRKFNSETLMPFEINGNADIKTPFKVVLLVNEMCASMCDIFTAVMKDNSLATVVGSNTMGAGGNVVEHRDAPNTHLTVRQTESLILRKDGSYIENNGVAPDVKLDIASMTDTKYAAARKKAIDLFTQSVTTLPIGERP